MSNSKVVSIRDIAKKCNVSPSTVSRVINNKGRISKEKRQMILKAIEDSGYTVAQNNKKIFSSNIVGLLFPRLITFFYPHLIDELEIALLKNGYSPVIMLHNDDVETENNCLNIFAELDIKGLIMVPATRAIPENFNEALSDIPAVFVNVDHKDSYYTINSDQFYGGQLAALEFINKGCKKPLIICRRNSSAISNLRVEGFINIFNRNNIKIRKENILTCNRNKGSFSEAKDLIKYAYISGLEFDCVFADSDWKAFGSLVALQELGYRIPEEIKIIGYDDSDITKFTFLPITSISQELPEFSKRTVDLLLSLIHNNKSEITENNTISVSLKSRQTT